MRTICLTLFFILCSVLTNAQVNPNDHWVEGYYQRNGTYVPGHYQTDPNGTINDNFSTYPNVNPYTGKQGTIQPQQGDGTFTSPDGTFKVATYGQRPVQRREREQPEVRYFIDEDGYTIYYYRDNDGTIRYFVIGEDGNRVYLPGGPQW